MASRAKSFSSQSVSGRRYCKCGDEILILTSGSARNPGRKFFRCPNWKKEGSCNFFQWVDEDFEGGEGVSTGGGHCNCSKILVETLTIKIGRMKRKLMEERRKVKILKALIAALLVLLSAILLVEVGFFN
ncbi:Zinc finger, GRF-type [Sesbania bispinosa]|nr:Zinc finger, GRF-type [Sesbania bispinosa]